MINLLDADTLIRADSTYYPLARFPIFWQWLVHQGQQGNVKVPREQYDEVIVGKGDLVDFLKDESTKAALLLEEDVNTDLLTETTEKGYASDLNEAEQETVGRDPFLISYARVNTKNRRVISFEVSKPTKIRANRKVPDVCDTFGVPHGTLFDLIKDLDFSTNWKP